jgi:hypothetical protein
MVLVDVHLDGIDTALEATKGTFGFHDERSLLRVLSSTQAQATCDHRHQPSGLDLDTSETN